MFLTSASERMKRGVSALFERPPWRALSQNCFCDHSHSLSSRGMHFISARDIFSQICLLWLLLRVKKLPHHSQPNKLGYRLWLYPFLSINIWPAMNQLLPCSRSHVLSYLSSFCTVSEVHGFIQLLPGYLTTLGAATDPLWDPFFSSPVAFPPPSPPHPSLSFASGSLHTAFFARNTLHLTDPCLLGLNLEVKSSRTAFLVLPFWLWSLLPVSLEHAECVSVLPGIILCH